MKLASIIIGLNLVSVGTFFGQTPKFNAPRAFKYLETQCSFGPRNPGSVGHQKCLAYLESVLTPLAEKVTRQDFVYLFPGTNRNQTGTNLIANFNIKAKKRLLICAHWDSRPWADMDSDPKKQREPVLGANDGASGVAVLLEIAQQLKIKPPPAGVELVLFDAEDAGLYQNDPTWTIGSREYARRLNTRQLPVAGILLDLVGDAQLDIYIEENSNRNAAYLVRDVWQIARELGIYEFHPAPRHTVIDDHLNLLAVGVPCIDIIDFDYPYWHTSQDTPDKCSPESLSKVGQVVLTYIYRGGY
ncbi:M28 family peptidase [candidate division KSB1 bacterium]|nr:M28 family peptidase [candidate division KSB1 bacterium]